MQEQLDKAAQKESRVKRKTDAIGIKEGKEFAHFCDEKCDEVFNLLLNKFTETVKTEREIPKPMILGPSSLKLYESIQKQITKLISPPKIEEPTKTVEPVEPTVKKSMRTGVTPKQTSDIAKTVDVHNSRKTPDATIVTVTDVAAAAKTLEPGDIEKVKENTETKEIVDRLSYFIMEFVQNSLVEAV